MKHCIALSREIDDQKECRKVQRELPSHFCEGCSWFENIYVLKKHYRGVNKNRSEIENSKVYKVPMSGYLRDWLLTKAYRNGLNVNQLITKILREVRDEEKIREANSDERNHYELPS